jgi:hypothetical protein
MQACAEPHKHLLDAVSVPYVKAALPAADCYAADCYAADCSRQCADAVLGMC